MHACFACICLCATHMPGALLRPEEGVRSPRDVVPTAVSCHKGARNPTCSLWKNSQLSNQLFNH